MLRVNVLEYIFRLSAITLICVLSVPLQMRLLAEKFLVQWRVFMTDMFRRFEFCKR